MQCNPALAARFLIVLGLGTCVLTAGAVLRGPEYDEGYTLLLTAGRRLPDWPDAPIAAADARAGLTGAWSIGQIARDLRQGDVHPPLYFWAAAAWRDLAGRNLLDLRLLSVLFAVAGLACVGRIASLAGAPVATAMLMTLGSYGFSYTGTVARGFALAQLLTLAGVAGLLSGRRPFASGLLLGAATCANYLSAFAGAAAVGWALWRGRRTAALGFALWLPADLFFFLAQRGSRENQFPPFEPAAALARLARCMAAGLFGGLPLYAGAAQPAVAVAVAAVCVALVVVVVWRWRRTPEHALLGVCALAPPAGLLALGAAFGNTPIEIRYLAFAAPFWAVLLADALRERAAAGLVLTLQAAAIAGLLTRPETMQPQGRAAREAARLGGLAVVPRGDDGVGAPVAFALAAPDGMRLLTAPAGEPPDSILARVAGETRVVLVLLALDAGGRAALPAMRAAFAGPCWRPAGEGSLTAAFERACDDGREVQATAGGP
jgi:hypothetical protein